MEFGFHGNRGDDVAMEKVVDEMVGLAMFPFRRVNGQRLGAERIPIRVANGGELDFRESVQARRRLFCRGDR